MKLFSSDPQKTPFARIAASGEPMIPSIPSTAPPEILAYKASLDNVFDLHAAMGDIQKVIREIWVRLELNGLIMPVFQGTAVEHDAYGAPPYTVLANLLDVRIFYLLLFGVLLLPVK
jgi:amidase